MPAYAFPNDRTDLSVLRFVIRNGFSRDLADMLIKDLTNLLPRLKSQPAMAPNPAEAFHH